MFIFLVTGTALAGTWEPQWKFEKNVVNTSLTLPRIREIEKKAETDKKSLQILKKATTQRVFWVGLIDEYYDEDGFSYMLLRIGDDYVWAVADDTVRNLDFNRKGYKIGVKGNIVLDKQNKLYYLDTWSLVLIQAPEESGFPRFQQKYAIPGDFTYSYGKKAYKVESPCFPFAAYWIKMHNPHYADSVVTSIAKSIIFYSSLNNLDPRLMLALFTIESAMDFDAVSWSGAIGLGQLMPGTAEGLGVDPHNVHENILGATKYLKTLFNTWSGQSDQVGLSLASYNAGPGNVSRYGGIPPFSETVNYVFFIKFLYREICEQTKDFNTPTVMTEITETAGGAKPGAISPRLRTGEK